MRFKFEIKSITRLQKAGVAVLDGRLGEGSVTTGASAELVHAGQRISIDIKGVLLDSVRPGADSLSLVIDLRQTAASLVSVGDMIVSAS